jgi:hypothetical protein
MEKEFVPYELALELKQINFKERVLSYFEDEKPKLYHILDGWDFNTSFLTCVSRPTYSQVFDWFEKNHKMIAIIQPVDSWNNWCYEVLAEDIMSLFYVAFQSEEVEFKTKVEAQNDCILKMIQFIQK